ALRLEEVADSVTRRRKDLQKNDTSALKLRVARDTNRAFRTDAELLDSIEVVVKRDTLTRAALIELLRSKDKRQALLDSGFTAFGLDVFSRSEERRVGKE